MKRRLSVKKRIGFSIVCSLAFYGMAEAVLTAVMPLPIGAIGGDTFWIVEKGHCFTFDPIRGYFVSGKPARVARVTHGEIEYVGRFRGNKQGFQSDRDFTLKKGADTEWRGVVFGDSFTTAAFLETPWPKRVESLVPRAELLNFGTDGGGLANWWSVLTRLVLADGYDCDEVIFASIHNDLNRPFIIGSQDESAIKLGYVGWDPDCFPRDFDEALTRLSFSTFYSVTRVEFDASVRERRRCFGTNPHHAVHPWIASRVYGAIDSLLQAKREATADEEGPHIASPPLVPTLPAAKATKLFTAPQMAMILDMRNKLAAKHIPVVVIYIPGRDELLQQRDDSENLRAFAQVLGAEFVDGSGPFRGRSEKDVRGNYFPFDGHWNQTGSDRFAKLVAAEIRDRIPSNRRNGPTELAPTQEQPGKRIRERT